ncbi:hypothetical protein PHSY_002867 [Pseudozyma hubeiensis SY62]|uniref:Uncharacterized protein n=1 Tax=Pseudozyma hubeiensis (strain SY62) TaxID=1305764 RepID=R9P271_PSEHS|nr:hypothetical protein PHSY_002867 [Pseudozyma hubeiensis SY62]GAC95292.1 hypothetical protein PHSY_002867 [Pseudozyma hubeiensis SY62]
MHAWTVPLYNPNQHFGRKKERSEEPTITAHQLCCDNAADAAAALLFWRMAHAARLKTEEHLQTTNLYLAGSGLMQGVFLLTQGSTAHLCCDQSADQSSIKLLLRLWESIGGPAGWHQNLVYQHLVNRPANGDHESSIGRSSHQLLLIASDQTASDREPDLQRRMAFITCSLSKKIGRRCLN